jgi:YVTN family beta-propeller protein
MDFRILGPLEALDDGYAMPLGGSKQRALLAVLLLHANEVLSTDRLIDELWGDRPPATAAKTMQNHISRLRKALANGAENGRDGIVVTREHGYELRLDPERLDARRFERLAAEGRSELAAGRPEPAISLLEEALSLWRGPALADLAYEPFAQPEIGRLEDLRIAALEHLIEAKLALGGHTEVLDELERLIAEHPYRERLRAQLMLALYRSDRQADALQAYQDARSKLVDDLGIEPGERLRELERAILAQDPGLAIPSGPVSPPSARVSGLPRARRQRLALSAAGVLLLTASFAVLLLARGSGSEGADITALTGDALAAIDPATNRVVAQYAVGGTPTSVAVGGGAVWTVNADGQTISRVDMRSRAVKTFGLGAVPIDLAASRDAVWAVASDRGTNTVQRTRGPATLVQLEARSGAIVATTALRPSRGRTFIVPPQLVAAGSGAVWIIGRTRRLHRVDTLTGRARVLPRLRVGSVATGDGQVWALADRPRGEPDLVRLDPRTGAIRTRIELPATDFGAIAVGGGAVWLTDAFAGVVWRVDTAGKPVQRTIDVGGGVDSVAFGAGAAWAGNSVTGTVTRIDPATNAVKARVALGNTPRSVAFGGGRVWVSVAGGGGDTVPAAGSLRTGARITPLAERTCGPVVTGRNGDADVLVALDLPLQGESAPTSQSMAAAIAFVLRRHRFRAGRFRLGVQTCDDSTAIGQLPWDARTCAANAKAYAANPSVVGVVGPLHSDCGGPMLPILNRAEGGPLALVSFTTAKSLVRADPTDPAGALRKLYPTGQRGHARILPTEDYEIAAAAMLARRLGGGSVFYLEDNYTAELAYRSWFRRAARRIGLRIAGTGVWNAQARGYRRIAERVRASGVRAVYVLGHLGTNAQRMVQDLRAVLDDSVEIIGYSGLTPISMFFEEAGAAARGVHVVVAGRPQERLGPAGRRFVRAFRSTQPDGLVTPLDLYAAASTEVLLAAIARSDGTRASVTRALATMRLKDSLVGPLAFNRYGEPLPSPIAVVRAERRERSRPYMYNDIAGGVVEDIISPPARLVESKR